MNDSMKEQGVYVLSDESEFSEQQEQGIGSHPGNVAYDALVLDATLRQSLMTTRSLGRRGKRVAAMTSTSNLIKSRHVPTFASRWCQASYIAPGHEKQDELFVAYLKQVLDTKGARVLISSADGTIEVLRRHRKEIERHGVRVALPREEALAIAISKEQTLKVAQQLGLGVPRNVLVTSVSEVAEAVSEIGLPAVVKPTESWSKQGTRLICILVTTLAEARLAVEKLTQGGDTVLFQQYLSGRRECVNFMYAHGEMYARYAHWTKRTLPQLGGESTYRQTMEVPEDTGEQAERLIREIDLEGFSNVQFRRDSLGKPYLMEINPRLIAGVEIAVRAGVDFPHMVYQWACGEPIDRVEGYKTNLWMRYLEGEVLTTMQAFEQRGRPGVTPTARALMEFVGTFFTPTLYDYFDWQDLHPVGTAVSEFADHVQRYMKKR